MPSSAKSLHLAWRSPKKTDLFRVDIPGFGKNPPWASPGADCPMPFPVYFLQALGANSGGIEIGSLPTPFTRRWYRTWRDIAGLVNNTSRDACEKFFAHAQSDSLETFASKGCNPNFVMSVFTRYLWDPEAPEQEHKDPNAQAHLTDITAVQATRRLLANHTWRKSLETKLVDRVLCQLETFSQSYLNDLDFRKGRHLQNDKQNRVIYAIHCHLEVRNAGRQWRTFLELLVAAGALSLGITARTSTDETNGSPDRRIKPHLKLFEKEHPKEEQLMRSWVRDWPADFKALHISSK